MASGSGPKWALDETSLLLGSLVLVVYLYNYLNLPTPDCHPALLANQASFSPTHLANETPIVRHKSSYFSSPLATTPNRQWNNLNDLFKEMEQKNFDFLGNLTRQTVTWLSSKNLFNRAKAFGTGIKTQFDKVNKLIVIGDNDINSLLAIFAGLSYGYKVITLKNTIVVKSSIVSGLLKENQDSLILAHPRYSKEVHEALESTQTASSQLIWLASSLESFEGITGQCSSDIEVNESQILPIPDIPSETIGLVNYFFKEDILSHSEFSHSNLLAGLAGMEYILPIQSKIQAGVDSIASNMWFGSPSVLSLVLYALYNQAKYCLIPLESNPIDHDETPFDHVFTHLQKFKPTIVQLSQPMIAHIHFHLRVNTYKTSMMSNLFLNSLLKSNIEALKKGHLSNSIADRIVFAAVRSQLGDNVRLIFVENTQIPNRILNTVRVALSSQIIPYYNLDSIYGWTFLGSCFDYENRDYSLIGAPLGNLEAKLCTTYKLPLTIHDQPYSRGELFIKGAGLSANLALTQDGWYSTGVFCEMEHSGAFRYLGTLNEVVPGQDLSSHNYMSNIITYFLCNRYVLDIKLEHLPPNALPMVEADLSFSGLASTARYPGLRFKVVPRVEALPGLVQAQYKISDGSGLPAVEVLLLEELIHVARIKKLPRTWWPSRVKLITLEDVVGHI